MAQTRNISGFTLIELMVTITVIGIAASMAIPTMTGAVQRASQMEEVERVKELITIARDRARSERRCVQLYLDTDGALMTTFENCQGVRRYGSSTPTVSDPMPNTRTLMLGNDVTFESIQTLTFTPWGGLASAQNREIRLMDGSEQLKSVKILSALGVISGRTTP